MARSDDRKPELTDNFIAEDEWKKHRTAIESEGFQTDRADLDVCKAQAFLAYEITTARAFLETLRSFETRLGSIENQQQILALFTTFIMTYGRLFVAAGRQTTVFSAASIFAGSPDLMKVHQRIMNLRHKVFAHSDNGGLVRCTVACRETSEAMVIRHYVSAAFPMYEVQNYLKVLDHVERYSIARAAKIYDKIEQRLHKRVLVE